MFWETALAADIVRFFSHHPQHPPVVKNLRSRGGELDFAASDLADRGDPSAFSSPARPCIPRGANRIRSARRAANPSRPLKVRPRRRAPFVVRQTGFETKAGLCD